MEYVGTFFWIHNVILLWLCSYASISADSPTYIFVGELFGPKWMSK